MDNEDIAELLRYQRMLKQGTYKAVKIAHIPRNERDDNQNLFLEMYIKN